MSLLAVFGGASCVTLNKKFWLQIEGVDPCNSYESLKKRGADPCNGYESP
jgi:hypothetical protein